jgi:hypothetical protein
MFTIYGDIDHLAVDLLLFAFLGTALPILIRYRREGAMAGRTEKTGSVS